MGGALEPTLSLRNFGDRGCTPAFRGDYDNRVTEGLQGYG